MKVGTHYLESILSICPVWDRFHWYIYLLFNPVHK